MTSPTSITEEGQMVKRSAEDNELTWSAEGWAAVMGEGGKTKTGHAVEENKVTTLGEIYAGLRNYTNGEPIFSKMLQQHLQNCKAAVLAGVSWADKVVCVGSLLGPFDLSVCGNAYVVLWFDLATGIGTLQAIPDNSSEELERALVFQLSREVLPCPDLLVTPDHGPFKETLPDFAASLEIQHETLNALTLLDPRFVEGDISCGLGQFWEALLPSCSKLSVHDSDKTTTGSPAEQTPEESDTPMEIAT